MSDDITFCMAECDKTKCFRHPSNIRDKTIPHSYANFFGDLCAMKESEMTKTRTVDGMICVQSKIAFSPITIRVTRDASGQSLSLADDRIGVMLEIPVEPVKDLVEVKR